MAVLFPVTYLMNQNPFGGDGGGVPHVPIPNTTVKPSSADGTWTEGSWESRTSPSKDERALPMIRWCSFCSTPSMGVISRVESPEGGLARAYRSQG